MDITQSIAGNGNNCYVLFVKTGNEKRVADLLKINKCLAPFIPMIEYYHIRKGKEDKRMKICFRGYVFIKSNLEPDNFIYVIDHFRPLTNDIFRVVNYGEPLDIALHNEECLMLDNIFGTDHCLHASQALVVGNRVHIVSGALLGMESVIKRISHRRKEAVLEIDFLGTKRELWVGLEILEKI